MLFLIFNGSTTKKINSFQKQNLSFLCCFLTVLCKKKGRLLMLLHSEKYIFTFNLYQKQNFQNKSVVLSHQLPKKKKMFRSESDAIYHQSKSSSQLFESWLAATSVDNNNTLAFIKQANRTRPASRQIALDGIKSQTQQLQQAQNNNTIRIFISSTFSDMAKERDLIASRVAPRITKFSESLGITTTFVDLRWGVTSEQVESNDAVSICLGQVLRSDIVLVFCAHRYGFNLSSLEMQAALALSRSCSTSESNFGPSITKSTSTTKQPATVPIIAAPPSQEQDNLVKSFLHAAESTSTQLPWLKPILESRSSTSIDTAVKQSVLQQQVANYLLHTSVTELEIRAAFSSPGKNVLVFLRTKSPKNQVEDCPEAKKRLQEMRNALSSLPTTKRYDPIGNDASSSSSSQTTTTTTTTINPSKDHQNLDSSVISSVSELEETIFNSICQAIFDRFPDRQKSKEIDVEAKKPRKWERESQIQQVLADRSLIGFCEGI
jgi:hypothetical protein